MFIRCLAILVLLASAACLSAADVAASGSVKWDNALKQPGEWFRSADAVRVGENVLLWQRDCGGWDKNIDMAKVLPEERKAEIQGEKARPGTIDNDATTTQIRYLAKLYHATGDARFRAAAEKGLEYLYAAQYRDSGGWPQYFPLRGGYHDCITYNDNAMLNVMRMLRDIRDGESGFAFMDAAARSRAGESLAKAIDCVLKTQIIVNGKRTAWCAQHDAKTLAPAKARSYELPSISGAESVGLVRFLMAIEHPSREETDAIESAIAWFEQVKITGKRLVEKDGNRELIDDPDGPVMWARFYEIGTNRPIYCNRDGVIRYSFSELGADRRNGYAWIRPWANDLLAKDYPAWKARMRPAR